MDLTYVALAHARENVGDEAWVAPLPAGPLMCLTGVAPLILHILSEADGPLNANEIIGALKECGLPVPDDASDHVRSFLQAAVARGILAIAS